MKNFKTNLLGLALAGLIFGACSQTGTYEQADLMNEQAAADKAGFKLTPFGMGNANARTYAANDCVNFCIDPLNPEYSFQTATISNNSGPNTRVFTYTVNNTLTGFDLAWSYAASNNAGRKLKITVSGAGIGPENFFQSYTTNQLNGSGGGTVNGSHTFPFTTTWNACGIVTVKAEILDGDNVLISGPNTTTYGLIGECVDACDDESFAYSTPIVDEEGIDVTFSYSYSEEAEVSLSFTFPQIILDITTGDSYRGADGKIYTVTGNGTVFHWNGPVSCSSESPTTFAFEGLVPDCGSGNAKDGQANIWTDAKVTAINGVDLVDNPETLDVNEGPYSLKGDLDNIVFEGCPIPTKK